VGWASSQHSSGWGYNEPGTWPPGRYRLEVLVNGRKVAETSVEIES